LALTGRVEELLLLSGLERAAGCNDVASAKHASQRPAGWSPYAAKPDPARIQDRRSAAVRLGLSHLGRFWRAVNVLGDQVRKVVKIGVAVFCPPATLANRSRVSCGIADE